MGWASEDWINVAQNADKLGAHMNTVTKLRTPQRRQFFDQVLEQDSAPYI